MRRSGTTMLEILVFAMIVGCALISLIGMGTTIHRETRFTRHELSAWLRARFVLDVVCSIDPALLERTFRSKPGDGTWRLSFDDLLARETLRSLFALSPDAVAELPEGPVPALAAARRGEDPAGTIIADEWIECTCPEGAASLRLTATVEWHLGTDRGVSHRVALTRIVGRGPQS